jgi:trimethylamine--corrinoid protein Co-methyltransferase
MVSNYQDGIEVNEEMLAKEVISDVGHGGHYLSTEHTMNHMKDFRDPILSSRATYTSDDDLVPAVKRANEKCKSILTDFEEPYLDSAIENKLLEYIDNL